MEPDYGQEPPAPDQNQIFVSLVIRVIRFLLFYIRLPWPVHLARCIDQRVLARNPVHHSSPNS